MKKPSSLLFLSGVILGAAVGSAMGIIFAPASGEETRKKITKKGKKAWKEIELKAKEVGQKVEPALEGIKKELSSKAGQLQKGLKKGVKTARR